MNRTLIIIYIWDVFWIYWILAAIHTRLKVKKETNGQKFMQRSIHLIFVVIAFIITFFQFTNVFLYNEILPHNLLIEYIGMMILVLSLLFAIWARIILGKNWSGAIQKVEGQRLIHSGPYRYIRNPIYTGIVFGFLGTFVSFGTLGSLLGFCIILIAYIAKISEEQKFLIIEFEEEYRVYIKESWALIPYIF